MKTVYYKLADGTELTINDFIKLAKNQTEQQAVLFLKNNCNSKSLKKIKKEDTEFDQDGNVVGFSVEALTRAFSKPTARKMLKSIAITTKSKASKYDKLYQLSDGQLMSARKLAQKVGVTCAGAYFRLEKSRDPNFVLKEKTAYVGDYAHGQINGENKLHDDEVGAVITRVTSGFENFKRKKPGVLGMPYYINT